MRFTKAPIDGAFVIDIDRIEDHRGFFARFYCQKEMAAAGIDTTFVQINNSYSAKTGTLRGLHYQAPPHGEAKLMRCIHGAIWDCIVDVRPGSPSYGQWFGIELSAENRRLFYVPAGCAHGFLTLAPDAETIYLSSAYYTPGCERGVRYNDPRFAIEWPIEPVVVSDKDAAQPDFVD